MNTCYNHSGSILYLAVKYCHSGNVTNVTGLPRIREKSEKLKIFKVRELSGNFAKSLSEKFENVGNLENKRFKSRYLVMSAFPVDVHELLSSSRNHSIQFYVEQTNFLIRAVAGQRA